MSLDCPCGFGARYELGTFSASWHREHMAHHLATFPDVDQVTRDNLAMLSERDLCTYGRCWCGEPRQARTVYEADEKMWRSELVCYAGHAT